MRGFFALAVLVLLGGCASNERISLAGDQAQQSTTRDGVPELVSYKKQVVMLRPVSSLIQSGGRPKFVVAVYNRGRQPVDLRAAGITAQSTDATNHSAGLHVYSFDELVAEEQRKQRWAAFGAALGGVAAMMNAANAGYSYTAGTYSGNSYGRYSGDLNGTYSGSTTGTISATSYDAGRAYAAQQYANAQTAANFAAIQAEGQHALDKLQSAILKDNTVMPGEWVGGIVILDVPPKARDGVTSYRIDVQFGNEVHSFVVNQSRAS